MTPTLKRKTAKPDPQKTYIALEPIAGQTRKVKQSDELRGDDPSSAAASVASFARTYHPRNGRPSGI
jgi:hypothetical protein